MKGKVLAVCISDRRGVKRNVGSCKFIANHGLEGDVHSGEGHRQVSLLSKESIDRIKGEGLTVSPGDFGENIVMEGISVHEISAGSRIKIGNALLEVTQIGKECHTGCEIYKQRGKCIMPKEGIFASVLTGGIIKEGDAIGLRNETKSQNLD
ncbi:MAG: MOSC domain-containing protein [Candidatus Altiarchaeales archaeon]|nr:MOSC domain-containing protein [Candidatus Altiarchaeota archaeon]MCG2783226.1 MOSC domain-containing protein [Candidatus Altiarchaeales archaeon]MBU4266464.1 MOSC domain-containing protein [Candidatus Altiarchaeota archaeon]MBU4341927.1 MOSC domain-containing protein [Candidatus Altiarchaeota archaeon]MBU4406199.1 MOSC domain-containing protein [Candidatus Altiarchaeota archaeon]